MNPIDIVLILAGLFLLYGVTVKPRFFWEGRRMKLRRKIMGDQNAIIMYVVMGALLIGVGIWGAFQ